MTKRLFTLLLAILLIAEVFIPVSAFAKNSEKTFSGNSILESREADNKTVCEADAIYSDTKGNGHYWYTQHDDRMASGGCYISSYAMVISNAGKVVFPYDVYSANGGIYCYHSRIAEVYNFSTSYYDLSGSAEEKMNTIRKFFETNPWGVIVGGRYSSSRTHYVVARVNSANAVVFDDPAYNTESSGCCIPYSQVSGLGSSWGNLTELRTITPGWSEPSSPFDPTDINNYPVPTRSLSSGCSGNDVRWLQTALYMLGYYSLNYGIDGIFGSGTLAAVKSFQSDYGLQTDGVAGSLTVNKIIDCLNPTPVPSTIDISASSLSLGLYTNTTARIVVTCNGDYATFKGKVSSSVYNFSLVSQNHNVYTIDISSKAEGTDTLIFFTEDAQGERLVAVGIDVTVTGASFTASVSSVSLALNGTYNKTMTVIASGNLPSSIICGWDYPSDICTVQAGAWSGTQFPLTVTGKAVGNGVINLYLSDAATNKTIKTATVSVSVTGAAYSIYYNANGGSNPPATQTKQHNTDIVIASSVPSGSSYTVTFDSNGSTATNATKAYPKKFSTWNTKSDGTGKSYPSGSIYSDNSSVTLYAKWDNPEMGNVTQPQRSGYYFLGWFDTVATNSQGFPTGTQYFSSTKITKSMTLYAMWTLSSTLLFGDYNLDGILNGPDSTAFRMVISGEYADFPATGEVVFRGDLNADGVLNADDISLLSLYRTGQMNYSDFPAVSRWRASFNVVGKKSYEYGEAFNISGWSMYFSGGSVPLAYHIIDTNLEVRNYDPYKIGTQTIKICYYQYSYEMDITVNPPKYILSFDANGGQSNTTMKEVIYGKAIGELPQPERDGYTFASWTYTKNGTDSITSSTVYNFYGSKTVYAKWNIKKYTVKFIDGHTGEILSTQTVEHGKAANAPEAKEYQGYEFVMWDKEFGKIQQDTTITATYKIKTYTVTFKDGLSGYEIAKQNIEYLKGATAPTAPEHEGYSFSSWDKAFNMVTADITVTAEYALNVYTVTFSDEITGRIFNTQTVLHGTAATEPTPPEHDGYVFANWNKEFEYITSNLAITAQYKSKEVKPTDAQFVVGNVSGKPGETVTVNVEIKNNPGLIMASLYIGYDAGIAELVSVTNGSVISGDSVTFVTSENTAVNPYCVIWVSTSSYNYTGSGIMMSIKFKIKSTAAIGESSPIVIVPRQNDMLNINLEQVYFASIEGSITVQKGGMLGDASGDGILGTVDALLILRYMAGWSITLDMKVCDVNGDGDVGILDALYILRYLADWEVPFFD